MASASFPRKYAAIYQDPQRAEAGEEGVERGRMWYFASFVNSLRRGEPFSQFRDSFTFFSLQRLTAGIRRRRKNRSGVSGAATECDISLFGVRHATTNGRAYRQHIPWVLGGGDSYPWDSRVRYIHAATLGPRRW